MAEMLGFAFKDEPKEAQIEVQNFRLNRQAGTVCSSVTVKKYTNRLTDKRVLMSDPGQGNNKSAMTLPFGLKHYGFSDVSYNDVWE